jgi:rod shape-determining protein RodA
MTARLRRFRLHLPLLALAVLAIGLVFIHSAAWDANAGTYKSFARDQVKWAGIGLAGFLAAVAIPYRHLERHAYLAYGVALALLLGLPVFGAEDTNGARSWYELRGVKFQPSEPMKIALIAAIAKLLMFRKDLATWGGLRATFLLAAPPLALVLAQNDLGTILVFFPAIFAMLFVAGARLRHFAAIGAAAAIALPLAYRFLLKGYQKKRIDVFLSIFRGVDFEPRGAGYHAFHSRLAIGSGGLTGHGLGEGPETQLHTLPDNHTDFIFAVIGEEGGFLACALVLALLLTLVLSCLEVAWRTREPFGRLLVTGIAAFLAGQVFVNAGMTVGLVPITGITLPFVSYGGSSLLTCFLALGLVVNVGMRPVPELGGFGGRAERERPA